MNKLVVLLGLLLFISLSLAQSTLDENGEWELFSLLNNARASNNRGYIQPSNELRGIARNWAKYLADRDLVQHNPNLASQISAQAPGWSLIGENVGKHVGAVELNGAWWASSGHKANMIRPEFNWVGIGLYRRGQYVYGVTVFSQNGRSIVACCGVSGQIAGKYNSGNWRNVLGVPETNERVTPDRVGRYNHFQHGSIYWTPSTGARVVYGNIKNKWAAAGWETSVLRYPTTDELTTPNGRGKYNHFQGGSIYWTSSTGARIIKGSIKEKWGQLGWEAGALKFPTTDELTCPDGVGKYNHFEGGSIYWTPSTGAHEVRGAIKTFWANSGWETGPLGYPKSDQYNIAEGARSDFQKGSLIWNKNTNQVRRV